jgi:hypothetical protein
VGGVSESGEVGDDEQVVVGLGCGLGDLKRLLGAWDAFKVNGRVWRGALDHGRLGDTVDRTELFESLKSECHFVFGLL